jgi:hypothetical protein
MSRTANSQVRSLEEVRAGLIMRLRTRRLELEKVIFARVNSMAELAGIEDVEYTVGLRAAVAAVVEYGLLALEQGGEWPVSVPPAAVAQAHRAARGGVSLETVLLRYTAGHMLLVEFIMEEAEQSDFSGQRAGLRHVLRVLGSLLERLQASIASEYKQEVKRMGRSPEQRRAELVQRLLAGASVDAGELGYELDAWHLGMIATGVSAEETIRYLARSLDRHLLSVARSDESVWAWLGGRQRLETADIERLMSTEGPVGVSLAIGESGRGVEAWRLTHHQAQGALLVALHRPQRLTLYAEDMLLAAVLRDDTLAKSLEEVYLSPLGSGRDGAALCETLRAYFAAGHNVKETAEDLDVDRNTVRNRLDKIERRLGYLPRAHQAELEVALRLEALHKTSGDRYDSGHWSTKGD